MSLQLQSVATAPSHRYAQVQPQQSAGMSPSQRHEQVQPSPARRDVPSQQPIVPTSPEDGDKSPERVLQPTSLKDNGGSARSNKDGDDANHRPKIAHHQTEKQSDKHRKNENVEVAHRALVLSDKNRDDINRDVSSRTRSILESRSIEQGHR